MEINIILSVIIAVLCLNTVSAYLRCIECTHISWDPSVTFPGSQQIYDILLQRYNPACAMQYPLDRRAYEQLQLQQQQNQQQSQIFAPNNYAVGETICPAISDTNRCNYIFGNVEVNLRTYNAKLMLNMHVRNCMNTPSLENRCYPRDTNLGYNDIKNFFQDRLSFLSGDLEVTHFYGNQCVCNTDLCSAEVSSAVRIQSLSFAFVSLLISYFLAKLF